MTTRLVVLCLAFLGSGIAGAQLITVDRTKLPAPHTTVAHPSKHIGALSAAVDGIQPSDAIILELGQGYNAITGDYLPDVCVDKVRDDKVFGQTQIGTGINHEYIDAADKIDWIEAADYYCCLHVNGHRYMLRESIAELSEKLDPQHFARIHRSSIVNLNQVKEIHRDGQAEGSVVLMNGKQLRMSRRGRQKLLELGKT